MRLTFAVFQSGCYHEDTKSTGGISMELEPGFFKTVWHLALPIALQSVLQASFSVVDQILSLIHI